MGSIEKRKIVTAIVIVPPLIFLIAMGPPGVVILMVLLATYLGLCEFYKLALPDSIRVERWMPITLGLILSLLISRGDVRIVFPFFVLLLLGLSILFMVTSKNLSSAISGVGIAFFGIFYIGFLLSHISLIRNLADGRQWVLFLIATVWAGDISAFLTGSFLGRHKLYPKISPKKTCEGLAGAIGGSVLTALVFTSLFLPRVSKSSTIFLAIGIGLLGQAGDFTESMLKRSAQVKDSGSLIPGHGGMLDRLDSFLFSAPFLHYSLLYLMKETP
ncbi:MAG: phosphatidate cytidylyltransferase [Syntrophaceae bacterium]|nr:phosphatidate cytidylyltransferase [Syntrophaceae bacterium]